MPAQSSTKMQVQAYRFGMRRLEHAVANGQPYRRTLGGPRPTLSFLVGFILAALVLAGFAVYALISPSPSIGDAKVLIDGDNGGAYVLRGKTLHPALNYSSALLAAGNSTDSSSGAAGTAKPKVSVVDADTLADLPKGQTLGIEGAPNQIPGGSDLVAGSWTVCDTSTIDTAKAPSQTPRVTTTVVLGLPTVARSAAGTKATLVSADSGKTVYLLEDGRAVQVDTDNRAVAVALGSSGTDVRPVSAALLSVIPRGPKLAPPSIPGAGEPTATYFGPNITAGTVFRVQYAQQVIDYVALKNGYERLTPLLSDLIRANDTANQSTTTIPFVALSTLRRSTSVAQFALTDFPSARPDFRGVQGFPVICLGWDGTDKNTAYSVYPTDAVPVPSGATPVPTPADSPAGVVNSVYIAPRHGELIGEVINPQQKPENQALFLVTDEGVKYPIVSKTALSLLGLDITKVRGASQAMLSLLPTGPTLDPKTASQYYGTRDGN